MDARWRPHHGRTRGSAIHVCIALLGAGFLAAGAVLSFRKPSKPHDADPRFPAASHPVSIAAAPTRLDRAPEPDAPLLFDQPQTVMAVHIAAPQSRWRDVMASYFTAVAQRIDGLGPRDIVFCAPDPRDGAGRISFLDDSGGRCVVHVRIRQLAEETPGAGDAQLMYQVVEGIDAAGHCPPTTETRVAFSNAWPGIQRWIHLPMLDAAAEFPEIQVTHLIDPE
jgi:hypothetical protein